MTSGNRTRGIVAALMIATASWVVVSATLLKSVSTDTLRTFLMTRQIYSLDLQFAILAAAGFAASAALWPLLRTTRRQAIVLGLLVLSIFAACVMIAPRTNRIFFDEQIYQGVAQNLSDLSRAQLCNDGIVEYGRLQCLNAEYNKQPYAYPYLLSIEYRLFGVRESVAFWVNRCSLILLMLVVFAISQLLQPNTPRSLLAVAMTGVIPELLMWCNGAAVEPTTTLFSAITVLAALLYSEVPSVASMAWLVGCLSFAVNFRPESLLLAPLVVSIMLLRRPGEILTIRFWCGMLASAVLTTPALAHLMAVRNEAWGAPAARFSLSYFGSNLAANGRFYWNDYHFPVALALLAVLGAIGSPWRAKAILVIYFLTFWGVFLFFYAGSYDYGADVRFSLLTYPSLGILAGWGCWRLTHLPRNRQYVRIALACTAAFIVFDLLSFLPVIREVGEEAWGARADVAEARKFAAMLPANSIVFTHNPSMFHIWGRNAKQMFLFSPGDADAWRYMSDRFAGGVYLHFNFWCNTDEPQHRALCAVVNLLPSELIEEKRERGYRFALYRISLPFASPGLMPLGGPVPAASAMPISSGAPDTKPLLQRAVGAEGHGSMVQQPAIQNGGGGPPAFGTPPRK